ncbi:IS1 family transposase, partial [Escherichia coli]|uniref:IS1 family transposase n=1 Tax=Escherichia coli TaxID=562 RepID=UPI0021BE225B
DGWPLYESRLKGKLHVISKRYTQRIERHNLNLRQHLARLGRKSLSFSKSVELHDKVIGHYLNSKRAARTVLTGMCYSVGSATRQGSSSPTRFIGQSAMT